MTAWKIVRYAAAVLFCILIITISFTFKGVMSLYSNSYKSSSIDIPVKKQVMGTDYSFRLPSGWTYNEKNFGGGEILYHADFSSPDNIIRGLAQVWKLNIPLQQFLEESKKSPVGGAGYKYYKLQKMKIGIYNGYVLEYSKRGNDGNYYKTIEYFIPSKNNYFFRISFFIRENEYNNRVDMIIKNIIDTIQVKNRL